MDKVQQQDLARPLFIAAPTGKCGTNFLARALIALGICELPSKAVLGEHYLMNAATLLQAYVDETADAWSVLEKQQEVIDERKQELLSSIGAGILDFVGQPVHSENFIVLKNPSCQNLTQVFELFPRSKLIVLVRDGRDVTESQVRAGYQPDYKEAFRNWAYRCGQLFEFIHKFKEGAASGQWMFLRFEDLVANTQSSLELVADYLGVDRARVDPQVVGELPVFGSSFLQGKAEEVMFEWQVVEKPWQVIAKPESFDPRGRWQTWDASLKAAFKERAGRELITLGYETDLNW